MPIERRRFNREITTRAMVPAACRVTGLVIDARLTGEKNSERVLLVGWDVKGDPIVLLRDGTLAGLGRDMTMADIVFDEPQQ